MAPWEALVHLKEIQVPDTFENGRRGFCLLVQAVFLFEREPWN